MGKGQGKKGRKEEKALAKKAKAKEPKLPGLPKLPNPAKIAKKLAAKEKKAAAVEDKPPKYEPGAFPTPLGRHKPFTKQHAKWPALFKKHIGVIESHIKTLDRIMMSMRADIDLVPAKERLGYELGERGNWRAICEMMDRARQTLCSAKEAAKGILPENLLKDKKGLGVTGTTFERLGPQLMKKAVELGYDPTGKGKLGRDPNAAVDEDGDSEMSDASDSDSSSSSSDSEDDADVVKGGADFVPLKSYKKASKAPEAQESSDDESSEDEEEDKPTTYGTEKTNQPDPSTIFFVDTEPTPVNLAAVHAESLSGNAKKRAKKAMLAAVREEKKANRHKAKEARLAAKAAKEAEKVKSKPEAESKPEPNSKSSSNPEPEAAKPEPDFNALAAKLQADIEAKEKAKAEAEAKAKAEKKADKKRRRSSDGIVEVIEKKAKKEDTEKKEQKEKKEKKRKADETEISITAEEVAGGKKKKRKEV